MSKYEFDLDITVMHGKKAKRLWVTGTYEIDTKQKRGPTTSLSLDPNIQEIPYIKNIEIEQVMDEAGRPVDEWEVTDDDIIPEIEDAIERNLGIGDYADLPLKELDEIKLIEAMSY